MGSRHRDWDLRCKVYVGNLGNDATKNELETVFSKYGNLRNVWVARSPPGFAFIEFEDPRDAEDAVRYLDGTRMCGARIKVEMSTGRTRSSARRGSGSGGSSYGSGRDSSTRGFSSGGGGERWVGGRRGNPTRSRSRSPRRRQIISRSHSRSRSRSRGRRTPLSP